MRSKFTATNIFFQQMGLEEERNPQCVKSTRCHVQIMKTKETRSLVQTCRKNGCTVQGIIQAVSNMAIADILHARGAKGPINVITCVPIDIRQRILDLSNQYQWSPYVKSLLIGHKTAKDSLLFNSKLLWNLARNFCNTVHSQIEKMPFLNSQCYIHCMVLERYFNRVKKINRRANDVSLVVSSLGRFAVSQSNITFQNQLDFYSVQ